MLWSPRHRRLRRLLDAYLDGALRDPESEELAEHLLDCVDCRRDADVTRRVKAALARMDEAAPPPLAAARLRRFGADLPPRRR